MLKKKRSFNITFDLFNNSLLDNAENILTNLTEEKQNEVDQVVTLLECAKEDSLKDFENENNLLFHRPIDPTKLNCLAGKNNAISTSYQTKWAVAVLKGIFIHFLHKA